jgi:serine/threonine protein kinase
MLQQLKNKCIKAERKGTTKLVYKQQLVEGEDNVAVVKIPLREYFIKEVAMLSTLNHPNIVKYDKIYLDSNNAWLIQPWLDRSISELTGKIHESDLKIIALQMLDVLSYLKSKGIIHRDIDSNNIMIDIKNDEIRAVLIDFDISTSMNNLCCLLDTNVYDVSEAMKPPEIAISGTYSYEADMWALGLTLFIVFTGDLTEEESCALSDPNCDVAGTLETLGMKSSELRNVISNMLNPDPKDRLEPDECIMLLGGQPVDYTSKNPSFNLKELTEEDSEFRCKVMMWFDEVMADLEIQEGIITYYSLITFDRLNSLLNDTDEIPLLLTGCLGLALVLTDHKVKIDHLAKYKGTTSKDIYKAMCTIMELLNSEILLKLPENLSMEGMLETLISLANYTYPCELLL